MRIKNSMKSIFSITNEYINGAKYKVIEIFSIKIKLKLNKKITNNLSFTENERCLVIAPHPDDETIGLGGLLLAYPNNFDVIVLSDGRYGGMLADGTNDTQNIIQERKLELKAAMEYIGISNYTNLLIEDQCVKQNLNKLKNINLKKYDYIFVPNSNESHPDHKYILNEIKKILRYSIFTRILSYEVWTPLVNPDIYFDINNFIDKKIELMHIYESQLREYNHIDRMSALNCYRGTSFKKGYAECFHLEKTFMQKLISK